MWHWYVYIIECKDGSYYTGRTWDVDLRWRQHLLGHGSVYTQKHKPLRMVYLEEYKTFHEAKKREKQIQGWTQIKKKKLIDGEWGKWQ